jgi:hypothetical protein
MIKIYYSKLQKWLYFVCRGFVIKKLPVLNAKELYYFYFRAFLELILHEFDHVVKKKIRLRRAAWGAVAPQTPRGVVLS